MREPADWISRIAHPNGFYPLIAGRAGEP
jgi:hypothetical protein